MRIFALISRVSSNSTVVFRASTLTVLNGQKGLSNTAEPERVSMLAGRTVATAFRTLFLA